MFKRALFFKLAPLVFNKKTWISYEASATERDKVHITNHRSPLSPEQRKHCVPSLKMKLPSSFCPVSTLADLSH